MRSKRGKAGTSEPTVPRAWFAWWAKNGRGEMGGKLLWGEFQEFQGVEERMVNMKKRKKVGINCLLITIACSCCSLVVYDDCLHLIILQGLFSDLQDGVETTPLGLAQQARILQKALHLRAAFGTQVALP